MFNKLIEEQLKKVKKANLDNFDPETNTYNIPQLKEIKLEKNSTYLLKLKDSLFYNEVLKFNWNNGNMPNRYYLIAEIQVMMSNMLKVNSVGYDPRANKIDSNYNWSG